MLALAITGRAIAAALCLAGAANAQPPLDPAPTTWRGLPMSAEQIFEGDLTINFETSVFRPDGAPAKDVGGEAVWLAGWQDRDGDNGGITRRYHIRFVGRQTVEPGKYGSLGAYKHTVLIDHMVSARLLIGQH